MPVEGLERAQEARPAWWSVTNENAVREAAAVAVEPRVGRDRDEARVRLGMVADIAGDDCEPVQLRGALARDRGLGRVALLRDGAGRVRGRRRRDRRRSAAERGAAGTGRARPGGSGPAGSPRAGRPRARAGSGGSGAPSRRRSRAARRRAGRASRRPGPRASSRSAARRSRPPSRRLRRPRRWKLGSARSSSPPPEQRVGGRGAVRTLAARIGNGHGGFGCARHASSLRWVDPPDVHLAGDAGNESAG